MYTRSALEPESVSVASSASRLHDASNGLRNDWSETIVGQAGRTFDQKPVAVPSPGGLVTREQMDAEIGVMVLPAGQDPDDVIRQDPGEWERLLQGAVPVIDYIFDLVVSQLDVSRAGDKAQAADQLLPLVAEITRVLRLQVNSAPLGMV